MNLQELQQQIINNELNNLYVFIGEEIAIQKIYINKIAKAKNLEIQYVDSYEQIINNLNVNDLFNTKKLYVILDDLDILKQENLWKFINLSDNIVIFKYNNLDKRNKFYKEFEPKIVEFNKLSSEVLIKYIQKEIDLNNIYCNQLIDICNGSYNQILLEIDKIRQYAKTERTDFTYELCFNILNNQGAFHKDVSDVIFNFIDAIVCRDKNKVFNLYNEFKKGNESILGFISLLYNNFKIILLIQSCKSSDIAKTTGLAGNQIYYNKNKINYYSNRELVNNLKLLHRMDLGIKRGHIEESIVLDYILVHIL